MQCVFRFLFRYRFRRYESASQSFGLRCNVDDRQRYAQAQAALRGDSIPAPRLTQNQIGDAGLIGRVPPQQPPARDSLPRCRNQIAV